MASEAVPGTIPPEWPALQERLAARVCVEDIKPVESIQYIGGCDITFSVEDPTTACVCVVVVDRATMSPIVLREITVSIEVPFIPGYLAFRESPMIVEAWQRLRAEADSNPDVKYPDVIMCDGNGIMHPRKCGVACQVALELGTPAIGVAKTYFIVDDIYGDQLRKGCFHLLKGFGDWVSIVGRDGFEWGAVVRTSLKPQEKKPVVRRARKVGTFTHTDATSMRTPEAEGVGGGGAGIASSSTPGAAASADAEDVGGFKPVFVSVGHGLSLASAVCLVVEACVYRVPEPIRIADKSSRVSAKVLDGVGPA